MFATGQRRNANRSDVRAFTLVELILVMTILATAFAVAAPSMANFFRGRTQNSEARRILSLIRYGQSRAVSEGIPMILWIDVRNGTYGLEQQAGYLSNNNDRKSVEYKLDKDLRLEVSQSYGTPVRGLNLPSIRFQPDGTLAQGSPQTITLREGESKPIWIVQSQNGMTYEIADENQTVNNTFR